ncbi:DNA-binding protein [Salmonella enterica]|nr:DNA-binding protein [Salmonella enterica]EBD7598143.1 Rha family transcriptional regulator [Salmonella enterica]
MNTLSPIAGVKQPMMGSREIAKVTSKEHRNVVRDINAMLEQLGIHRSNLNDDDFKGFIIKRKEYQGRDVVDEIWLDENLSMTLVTGYDAKRRLALIEQWQAMKIELEQPRPASLLTPTPTPTPIQSAPMVQINDGIVQLARVVAEATMKACLDATGYSQPATPTYPPHTEGEYVPVSKAAWKTGLSDSLCRKMIGFFKIPVRSTGGARGLLVSLPAMERAAQRLMNEAQPPKGNRKRWTHPQFGNFTYYADLI